MKLNWGTALGALGIGLFFGITVISIGLGAAITPMQVISAPIVCGSKPELETQHYSYMPGQSGYTITWYCVNARTGIREDKSWQLILASGVIYGLILGVILLAAMPWIGRSTGTRGGSAMSARLFGDSPRQGASLNTLDGRLAELKRLREADLITEEEYARTKAKILHEL